MSFKTKAISNTVNFKIGQEFEENNPGGKVVKVIPYCNKVVILNFRTLPRVWLHSKIIAW